MSSAWNTQFKTQFPRLNQGTLVLAFCDVCDAFGLNAIQEILATNIYLPIFTEQTCFSALDVQAPPG